MEGKYIVSILGENGEVVRTELYKNIKEISTKYNLTYHHVRSICDDGHLKKKSLQSYAKELTKKMKVHTNPKNIINLDIII